MRFSPCNALLEYMAARLVGRNGPHRGRNTFPRLTQKVEVSNFRCPLPSVGALRTQQKEGNKRNAKVHTAARQSSRDKWVIQQDGSTGPQARVPRPAAQQEGMQSRQLRAAPWWARGQACTRNTAHRTTQCKCDERGGRQTLACGPASRRQRNTRRGNAATAANSSKQQQTAANSSKQQQTAANSSKQQQTAANSSENFARAQFTLYQACTPTWVRLVNHVEESLQRHPEHREGAAHILRDGRERGGGSKHRTGQRNATQRHAHGHGGWGGPHATAQSLRHRSAHNTTRHSPRTCTALDVGYGR
jgi:hypothetical protein